MPIIEMFRYSLQQELRRDRPKEPNPLGTSVSVSSEGLPQCSWPSESQRPTPEADVSQKQALSLVGLSLP